jgi:HSP20 family protein
LCVTSTDLDWYAGCFSPCSRAAADGDAFTHQTAARRRTDSTIREDKSMHTTRSLSSTLDRMMTLNRALDQAFNAGFKGDARVWVPAIDVVEKKDAYVMYAELPGVDASQVDISFEQNVLTLRGTKRTAIDSTNDGELRVYAAERVTGAFERTVRLPEYVDGDAIAAEFNNGLLTITVPKAQAAQARRIEIKQGGHTTQQISSSNANGNSNN